MSEQTIQRRTRELPFDSAPITDEEIGEASKAMFALLDQEDLAKLMSENPSLLP